MNKLTIVLAFAAGLAGGMMSRFIGPAPVMAQSTAPKQIRAQSFVVENAQGEIVGVFAAGSMKAPNQSQASLRLLDSDGREVWRAGGSPVRPLAQR